MKKFLWFVIGLILSASLIAQILEGKESDLIFDKWSKVAIDTYAKSARTQFLDYLKNNENCQINLYDQVIDKFDYAHDLFMKNNEKQAVYNSLDTLLLASQQQNFECNLSGFDIWNMSSLYYHYMSNNKEKIDSEQSVDDILLVERERKHISDNYQYIVSSINDVCKHSEECYQGNSKLAIDEFLMLYEQVQQSDVKLLSFIRQSLVVLSYMDLAILEADKEVTEVFYYAITRIHPDIHNNYSSLYYNRPISLLEQQQINLLDFIDSQYVNSIFCRSSLLSMLRQVDNIGITNKTGKINNNVDALVNSYNMYFSNESNIESCYNYHYIYDYLDNFTKLVQSEIKKI